MNNFTHDELDNTGVRPPTKPVARPHRPGSLVNILKIRRLLNAVGTLGWLFFECITGGIVLVCLSMTTLNHDHILIKLHTRYSQ